MTTISGQPFVLVFLVEYRNRLFASVIQIFAVAIMITINWALIVLLLGATSQLLAGMRSRFVAYCYSLRTISLFYFSNSLGLQRLFG